jgi:hypothetical protein
MPKSITPVVQRWLPHRITSLTFCPAYDPFCCPGALFHAQLGELQNLHFAARDQPDYYHITVAMVQRVVDRVRDPFAQLCSLEACLDTAALRLLAEVFIRRAPFTRLHLTICSGRGCDLMLPTLASLVTLKSLRVQVLPPMMLGKDDLLALRQLRAHSHT